MDKRTIKDIISWDVVNWSKALDYWEKNQDLTGGGLQCLELGGREGGLSLWLALKGHRVICSDLNSPEKNASQVHQAYDCKSLISYEAINATAIPYQNEFDLVVFKSVLGGIAGQDNSLKQKTIEEIYKALKPGGVLLFAENMESSFLHRFFRKHFVNWGKNWNYLKTDEMPDLFSSFKSLDYISVGFLAAFGRTETQRTILGKLDRIVEKFVSPDKRYILIGVAKK